MRKHRPPLMHAHRVVVGSASSLTHGTGALAPVLASASRCARLSGGYPAPEQRLTDLTIGC